MSLLELFLTAVGLSMDAFAVAAVKGLAMPKVNVKKALVIALYFGIFQAIMPLAGYLLGTSFAALIEDFDHWIAFVLLGVIGGKMIYESFQKSEEEEKDATVSVGVKTMLPLALATSIDALAVGVSFALLRAPIVPTVSFIGLVTFAISLLGVKIGNAFGLRFQSKAELAGGVILVLIGVKILLEHLGILVLG